MLATAGRMLMEEESENLFTHVMMEMKRTHYCVTQFVVMDSRVLAQFVGKIVQRDSQILELIV